MPYVWMCKLQTHPMKWYLTLHSNIRIVNFQADLTQGKHLKRRYLHSGIQHHADLV